MFAARKLLDAPSAVFRLSPIIARSTDIPQNDRRFRQCYEIRHRLTLLATSRKICEPLARRPIWRMTALPYPYLIFHEATETEIISFTRFAMPRAILPGSLANLP
jgi:hypothetical protein